MLEFCFSDRNGGKSKVIPEEVEKRRSLFWELLYLDARLVSMYQHVLILSQAMPSSHCRLDVLLPSPTITRTVRHPSILQMKDAILWKVYIIVSHSGHSSKSHLNVFKTRNGSTTVTCNAWLLCWTPFRSLNWNTRLCSTSINVSVIFPYLLLCGIRIFNQDRLLCREHPYRLPWRLVRMLFCFIALITDGYFSLTPASPSVLHPSFEWSRRSLQ